ncbi:unnamed protein product [Prunus armeniaca]|uniref:Uncharacterized protein n=1 Tax=Prunus armeniaca TaxID=36596 RepID=A0A6J5WAA7_PRUAR|nr:unnamed protein product [Prunus armeniaca]
MRRRTHIFYYVLGPALLFSSLLSPSSAHTYILNPALFCADSRDLCTVSAADMERQKQLASPFYFEGLLLL